MDRKLFLSFILLCALCLSSPTFAKKKGKKSKKEDTTVGKMQANHSANLGIVSVLYGSYNLNYEYLHKGTHGILVETGYSSNSNEGEESSGFLGTIGYRWHWSNQQNSGFLGASLSYTQGTGSAESSSGDSFNIDYSNVSATFNIGKRWAWDSGFNITYRIGAGYGKYSFSTEDDSPEAQEATESLEQLLTLLPVAFEGELSVGWIF